MQAEWKDRIRLWKDELKKLSYLPIEEIDFEGFVTREQLSLETAAQRPRSPFLKGTQWGEALSMAGFSAAL